jgi:hypothetical protein
MILNKRMIAAAVVTLASAATLTNAQMGGYRGGGQQQGGPKEDMSCELPRGDEEGVFVCRTRTDLMTGETNTVPECIPIDKAIEGDAVAKLVQSLVRLVVVSFPSPTMKGKSRKALSCWLRVWRKPCACLSLRLRWLLQGARAW